MQAPKSSVLHALQLKNSQSPPSQASIFLSKINQEIIDTTQQHKPHNISINSANIHRGKKNSPNIVKDNKLFPNDFFIQQQNLNTLGSSPQSSQILIYHGQENRGKSLRNTQSYETQIEQTQNENIQKPLNKRNSHYVQHAPDQNYDKRYLYPLNEDHSKKQGSFRRRNLIEKQQQQQEKETFESLQNQFLHLSMDSDNIGILGFQQSKKALPFGQIEDHMNQRQRVYAGSPPPVNSSNIQLKPNYSKKQTKDQYSSAPITQDLNNQYFLSIQDQEQANDQSLLYQSQSHQRILPELRNSISKNQMSQYFENEVNLSQGSIPIGYYHDSITPPLISQRDPYLKVNNQIQKVPILMRHSIMREELEQSQGNLSQGYLRNQESDHNLRKIQVNQNHHQYLRYNNNQSLNNDSSSSLPRNIHYVRGNDNVDDIYNQGSPTSYQPSLNFDQPSTGKHSLNVSQLIQQIPQNNLYSQWSKSPQILRDLEIHQQLGQQQQIQFPQSTRNSHLSRSPGFSGGSLLLTEKQVKFPNIFNHNQQSNNNQQPQNQSKKGKINLDSNYQIVKNSRNPPAITEQDMDHSDSMDTSRKKSLKKLKVERKMLTSRDQEQRWVQNPQNIGMKNQLNRKQSKSKLDQIKPQEKEEYFEQYYQEGSPFSQSGVCWYNSPKSNKNQGIATFGPSPSALEQKKSWKHDQPRYSVPENKTSQGKILDQYAIQNFQQQKDSLFKKATQEESQGKLTLSELETPNFKQQNLMIGQRLFKQKNNTTQLQQDSALLQVRKLQEYFNQEVPTQSPSTQRSDPSNSGNQSRIEVDKIVRKSKTRLHDEVSLIEEEDFQLECERVLTEQFQNQHLQREPQPQRVGHVESSYSAAHGLFTDTASHNFQHQNQQHEQPAKKLKVVSKSKKKGKVNTDSISRKAQVEEKKVAVKGSHANGNAQEQQEQAANENNNNSQINKKIPMIKKSQILNNPPGGVQQKKIQITKKLGNLNLQEAFKENNQENIHSSGQQQFQNQHRKQRVPLSSIENQQVQQHIHHHHHEVIMAAQIPQEFNGMITFMNMHQQQQATSQDQGRDDDSESQFKKTGGSLMRGTLFSVNGSNMGTQGGSSSLNNSIIMLRSGSNYMTSDLGQGSPNSKQNEGGYHHQQISVYMQQQVFNGSQTAFFKQPEFTNNMKLEFQNSKVKRQEPLKPAGERASHHRQIKEGKQ